MHRFFVEPAELTAERVALDGSTAHQIARVLRLRPGEQIVLLDGSGRERVVELVDVTPRRVGGIIRATRDSVGEPRLALTLYQALVPRDKLEVVLQKGTEVGVSTFVLISCARSLVPRGDAVDERRLARWRRIVQEAAEQSGRGCVPEVRSPLGFADALAEAATRGPTLVAWEGERTRSVGAALREVLVRGRSPQSHPNPGGVGGGARLTASGTLSLFVGPEGGLTDAEIAKGHERGALTVSLGPRILRTETAGPVLAALALYEAGELEPAPDRPAVDACAGRSAS